MVTSEERQGELTLSGDQWRVKQEVADKLGGQLAEEVTGSRAIERHTAIMHHIYQRYSRRTHRLRHTQDLSEKRSEKQKICKNSPTNVI